MSLVHLRVLNLERSTAGAFTVPFRLAIQETTVLANVLLQFVPLMGENKIEAIPTKHCLGTSYSVFFFQNFQQASLLHATPVPCLCESLPGTSLQLGLMWGVFSNAYFFFKDIPPYESPMRASSSPISRIGIWYRYIYMVPKSNRHCLLWRSIHRVHV